VRPDLSTQQSGNATEWNISQNQKAQSRLSAIEWNGKDGAHPDERAPDDEGKSEFPAPQRGYCVYVPVND